MSRAASIADELARTIPTATLAAYCEDVSGNASLESYREVIARNLGSDYDLAAWDEAMDLLRARHEATATLDYVVSRGEDAREYCRHSDVHLALDTAAALGGDVQIWTAEDFDAAGAAPHPPLWQRESGTITTDGGRWHLYT